jgi:hypothetical protein
VLLPDKTTNKHLLPLEYVQMWICCLSKLLFFIIFVVFILFLDPVMKLL